MFRQMCRITLLAILMAAWPHRTIRAEVFSFEITSNGIDNLSQGALTAGPFTLEASAGPAEYGAVFREFNDGLGIASRGRSGEGFTDRELDKFDIVDDSNGNDVAPESMTFSFDRPGILTGMNFDGVKDEALEYFILESTGGARVNFFDSAANVTVPGAVDNAISGGVVTGEVVYLLEINSAIDDEAQDLSIPFSAGEQFTLTYAELPAEFGPTEDGNGSRLQGITVVPEPSALLLGSIAAGLLGCIHKREG